MTPMHILFLTDNFPPEVNAPASRTFEHCREWISAGHKVTVVTCAPNFPQGEVYPGYRNRLFQSEDMDGIRVVRVWTYITANEGTVRRMLDYISFMFSSVLASIFLPRPDVVVGTSPQFFAACAAYLVSILKWCPFIFELRDIWPESIKAVGAMKDGALISMLEWIELFLYRRAALIISVTESFTRNLVSRGISPGKIQVVTNGVDLSRFAPLKKDMELVAQYQLKDKFVAGYVGTHGMAHALNTILDAAALAKKDPKLGHIKFILLGAGATKAELVERAKREQLSNLIFIDSVSKDDVPRYWSLLDVSVIHLKKSELFKSVIPSKLFECMAMGIPVLHGVEGESADIVSRTGCGIPFEPEDAKALLDGIAKLADNPKLASKYRKAALAAAPEFDRTNLARHMLDHLKAVSEN